MQQWYLQFLGVTRTAIQELVAAMEEELGAPPPSFAADPEALTAQHDCPLNQQLLMELGTAACGWVKVTGASGGGGARWANTQHEFAVRRCDVEPVENAASAPLLIASFDLEVFSPSAEFPSARNPGDKIITCGVSF